MQTRKKQEFEPFHNKKTVRNQPKNDQFFCPSIFLEGKKREQKNSRTKEQPLKLKAPEQIARRKEQLFFRFEINLTKSDHRQIK